MGTKVEAASPLREREDPLRTSLANLRELLQRCFEPARVASAIEVGAAHGWLTRALLEGDPLLEITVVEPAPVAELRELVEASLRVELAETTSHEALRVLPRADAVILDGDHNYATLRGELEEIARRWPGAEAPLVFMHDLGWPHGRRDTYYAMERIPASERQPAGPAFLDPEVSGVAEAGIFYAAAASREGGPRNGTMTAAEDFLAARDDYELRFVPAFFGLGVLWHRDAPWGAEVAAVLAPWDRNPFVARLEANRILHIVEWNRNTQLYDHMVGEWERQARRERLLRAMLGSRAFAFAEWVSRFNQRGRPLFSRKQIRRVLGDEEPA